MTSFSKPKILRELRIKPIRQEGCREAVFLVPKSGQPDKAHTPGSNRVTSEESRTKVIRAKGLDGLQRQLPIAYEAVGGRRCKVPASTSSN